MANNWELRYTKTIDNKYRNFEMGGEHSYDICNIYCNFDITKLDKKDYIKGMNVTGGQNILLIDPTVDTEPPQQGQQAIGINTGNTTERTKKMYITNYYMQDNSSSQDYELHDIIISNPSKVILSGKRYPLEVCLIFLSNDKMRYLVVCVPMKVSEINTTDDPLKKDLFELLNIISGNFPTKNKTFSVKNIPNWNPLIFFPIKTEDNSSFYTWIDPSTNNTVKYIQFNNPNGALEVPRNFFEVFSKTLVGSTDIALNATLLPADTQYANLDIYYNENRPITDIITRYVTTEETIPKLQEMIDYSKEIEKDSKGSKDCKDSKDCKTGTNIFLILFLILFIFIIGYLIYKKIYLKQNIFPISH